MQTQPLVSERPPLPCSPPVSYMAMANNNLPLLRKVQESELQKKAMDVDTKLNVSTLQVCYHRNIVDKWSVFWVIILLQVFEYGTISDIIIL